MDRYWQTSGLSSIRSSRHEAMALHTLPWKACLPRPVNAAVLALSALVRIGEFRMLSPKCAANYFSTVSPAAWP